MSKVIKVDFCLECDSYSYGKCIEIDDWVDPNKIHPDCPLPDYVDVNKLQKERDEMVKALEQVAKWFGEYAEEHDTEGNTGMCVVNMIKRDHCLGTLAKIKGEI